MKRTSTKFSNWVGAAIVSYVFILLTIGVVNGAVNQHNITEITAILLASGVSFFGINIARVTTENVKSMKYKEADNGNNT